MPAREWRKDHVTGRRQPNCSQSFLSAPISDAGMITTAAVNSVVWMMVCLSALKTVLSRVSRLAARSLDSASQGYSTEKSPQGRCRGESREEGNWDDGRLGGITRTKGRFSYQAYQVRRFVQGQAVEIGHKFIATQVRGFQRHGGGTAQLPQVGPPQVEDAWTQAKTRRRKMLRVSEASVVTPWRPQQRPERERAGPAKFLWWRQLT